MTSGFAAQPLAPAEMAEISYQIRSATTKVYEATNYSKADEAWGEVDPHGLWGMARPDDPARGIVVYAHADCSFSVWDPIRNHCKPGSDEGVERRRAAYVFTEAEVWDGLWDESAQRPVPVCNGLLYDWAHWINAKDDRAEAMATVLQALAPTSADTFVPGPLVRLSLYDAREMPSIVTRHAGAVPVVHASAGVRRAVALAYVLT